MQRLRINIRGTVQGVGFRPHVYRVATKHFLTGWVRNDAAGVSVEIQGDKVDVFLKQLVSELPSLTKIDAIEQIKLPLSTQETTFVIKQSEQGKISTNPLTDVTTCFDCLTELFDPKSRYHHYPFISCTHCGPRYTLSQKLPFDRHITSMSKFQMCACCLDAYKNPFDRRYHAQTIACATCGPTLSRSFKEIAQAIQSGKIVALKGVGGYQLICDAKNSAAVARLRKNKHRPLKPFAVMVLNIESAKKIVEVCSSAYESLKSNARPIVIVPKRNSDVVDDVSPGLSSLGIMLPDTPIHYLLLHALLGFPDHMDWLNIENDIALVVSSANIIGSPLITHNVEAEHKLSAIADMVITHDRDIVMRVDDSVLKIIDNQFCFIRRARGFTPQPISLPYAVPNTLALGAYLKNTVCVTRGSEAFISQHIGDLSNRETIRFYRQAIDHLLQILDVVPSCVAHDLQPDFYSTQIANEFNVPSFAVQHHHAHLAAVAAEHHFTGEAIGLALDGFGLGDNGCSWGGELLYYRGVECQRLGCLKPLMQPGGDKVAQQPWRMAASVLFELDQVAQIPMRFAAQPLSMSIIEILRKKVHAPRTSSCGRLFDAVSALLGICEVSTYEGQAAMMLESKVSSPDVHASGWIIEQNQLSLLPLLSYLLYCDPIEGANLFHGTLAVALVEWVEQNAKALNLKHVLLSGGCFMNKTLSELVQSGLRQKGLAPLFAQQCPPNDGGLSLGQAWVAGNRLTLSS
jgi:hydrogenase maturation protein HypF